MLIVRLILLLLWAVTAWATWRAVSLMGTAAAGPVFFADLAHPWRGQFNIDFLAHLGLVGLWLGWTARTRWLGPIVGLCAILGGGFFTFAYLLVRSYDGDRSVRALLLGRLATNQL